MDNMAIREFDEFVDWVKNNIFDEAQAEDNAALESTDTISNRSEAIKATQPALKHARSYVDAPTEYDFPLSLLETILGLDRV